MGKELVPCVGGKETSEQVQFLEAVAGRVGRSALNGSLSGRSLRVWTLGSVCRAHGCGQTE